MCMEAHFCHYREKNEGEKFGMTIFNFNYEITDLLGQNTDVLSHNFQVKFVTSYLVILCQHFDSVSVFTFHLIIGTCYFTILTNGLTQTKIKRN